MSDEIPDDFQKFIVDYINETPFNYGENPVFLAVIPCDLKIFIDNFYKIINEKLIYKIVYFKKKDDRIFLAIEGHFIRCLIMKFVNVAGNIYEFHVSLTCEISEIKNYF